MVLCLIFAKLFRGGGGFTKTFFYTNLTLLAILQGTFQDCNCTYSPNIFRTAMDSVII